MTSYYNSIIDDILFKAKQLTANFREHNKYVFPTTLNPLSANHKEI